MLVVVEEVVVELFSHCDWEDVVKLAEDTLEAELDRALNVFLAFFKMFPLYRTYNPVALWPPSGQVR